MSCKKGCVLSTGCDKKMDSDCRVLLSVKLQQNKIVNAEVHIKNKCTLLYLLVSTRDWSI